MPPKPPRQWIPDRPDPRGAAPARLGELLVGAETFVAKQTGAAIPREEWRQIVGPRIAARTRVGRMNRGVLTVHVASSAWSSELSFLKSDLLAKLNRAGREVRDLRFYVDQVAAAPKRPYQQTVAAPEQTELPADLVEKLQQVEDPTLRAAIAEAARWSLTTQPKKFPPRR